MNKKKILVVDDESGFTRLLKLTLPRYEIKEENDARQAVRTAKEFKPDLILLDVIMPFMDGGDLASQIRAESSLKHIPIVFLTAIVTSPEAGTGAREIGGFPFLAKPVSTASLTRCIEEHLPA
jgi:two-component system OmpR family response regulator